MSEIHLCDYGCKQEAKYKLKNNKWCCSSSINSCPSKKEKSRLGHIGKKHDLAKPTETEKTCSFGCGEKANFIIIRSKKTKRSLDP